MSYFLFDAVKKGNLSKLKRIIERGKSPNIKDPKDKTPLHFASWEGHLEICEYLVEKGAEVNFSTPRWKKTPLILASYAGRLEVVKFLHSKGADPNSVDESGWTPLHFAAQEGHKEVISFLVSSGADLSIKNNEGKTAIEIAPPELRPLFSQTNVQPVAPIQNVVQPPIESEPEQQIPKQQPVIIQPTVKQVTPQPIRPGRTKPSAPRNAPRRNPQKVTQPVNVVQPVHVVPAVQSKSTPIQSTPTLDTSSMEKSIIDAVSNQINTLRTELERTIQNSSTTGGNVGEVQLLKEQVAKLTKENVELKKQLSTVKNQLLGVIQQL